MTTPTTAAPPPLAAARLRSRTSPTSRTSHTSPTPTRTHSRAATLPRDTARPALVAALALTLALTLALAACGGGDGIPPGELFDRPEVIGEEALEVIGTSDNLAQVVDLAVADDGTVWLMNGAPPFFVALDADGREVAVGGQRGGGPGEFGQPTALVRLDSGIWTWDTRRGALAKVSGADGLGAGSAMLSILVKEPDGTPMRTAVFSDMLLVGARSWVGGRRDEAILARIPASNRNDARSLWTAEFVAVDAAAAGSTSDTGGAAIFASTPHLASPETKYPGAEFFLPMPLWSQCPDGTMTAYDPVQNALVRVDAAGEPMGSVPLPPAREIEATADHLFDDLAPHMLASMPSGQAPALDEIRAGFMGEFEQVRSQLSRVMPEYRDLACAAGAGGSDGLQAWLLILEVGQSASTAGGQWLRVSLSADAEARVFRMPDQFRPFVFGDGVAWGLRYDDLEVPYLARLGLPR